MSESARIRALFREHGLSPKKWMGQNLLVDAGSLRNIVEAARVQPDQPVVEIGAGFGVLTRALSERGARIWAIEIDAGFFRVLGETFGHDPRVTLIHADALRYDFRGLSAEIGKLRVVANLPYSISSRLLFRFLENRELFSSLLILLQQEVAQRLVAQPGTKEYGVLTVMLGVTAEVELLFTIPPKAFFPVPEVHSTLIHVTFPEEPPIRVADMGLLVRLVKASFAGRRKTLRNTLRSAAIPGVTTDQVFAAAEHAGIDLGRRAETLSPAEFAGFADAVVRVRA